MEKRIQTLEYLQRAHLGKMYWFNVSIHEEKHQSSRRGSRSVPCSKPEPTRRACSDKTRAHAAHRFLPFQTILLEKRDLDSLFDPPRMRMRSVASGARWDRRSAEATDRLAALELGADD